MIEPPYTDDDFVIPAHAVRETDKALKVITAKGTAWVPRSQIRRYSDCYYPGDRETLVVSLWWARKVGWA